jgi:outer membrane autotransporter protein
MGSVRGTTGSICAVAGGRYRFGLVAVFALALVGATALATRSFAQSYSSLFPGTGVVTLPGMNAVQNSMAGSINNVCPPINTSPTTSAQKDLANICSTMIGTSLAAQGQANPLGLPSWGLDVTGTKNALQGINGGGETTIPTSQASQLRVLQGNVIGARLSVLRTRLLTGTASDDPHPDYQVASTGTAADDLQLAQTSPTEASFSSGRLGLFVNALGQFGGRDSTGSEDGYSFNNIGTVFGLDYRFTDKFVAGGAFGYTHSNTDFDVTPASAPGQYIHSNLFQGNLYATVQATDALYFNWLGTVGGGSSDSVRHIIINSTTAAPSINRFANGSFGTQTYSAALEAGYAIPIDALTLTPTARFEYRRLGSDSFSESGASGLDLSYGGTSTSAVLSMLGGQASYAISTSFGVLSPTVRADWAHQYNNGNTSLNVTYANDPTQTSNFVLLGDAPTRNYFDVGAGVAAQLQGDVSLFINYDAIVGLSHTSYNSFTAGVRLAF